MASQIPSLVPLKTSTSRNLSSPSSDLLDTTSPKPEPVPPAPTKNANKSPQYLLDEGPYAPFQPSLPPSLKQIQDRNRLLTERIKTINEQLHLTPTKNTADIENYEKLLSQFTLNFDAQNKRIEARAAHFRQEIKNSFETDRLQKKEEPHTASSESFATKTGPPTPAQFIPETNRPSPAPSQPCPSKSMAGSLPTSDFDFD